MHTAESTLRPRPGVRLRAVRALTPPRTAVATPATARHLAKLKRCPHETLTPILPPQPWHPGSSFLSPWIWPRWGPRMVGIFQHLSFRVWLISLNVMSSGPIHVVTCQHSLLFAACVIFRCVGRLHCSPIPCRWTPGCSHMLTIASGTAVARSGHISGGFKISLRRSSWWPSLPNQSVCSQMVP